MGYLQMDGVDDRIDLPSLTFTEFEMDFEITNLLAFKQIMVCLDVRDVNSFFMNYGSDGNKKLALKVFTSTYLNGVMTAVGGNFPTGRMTIRGTVADPVTTTSKIFCNQGNAANMTGNIYSFKFTNAGTVVAQYDMSKGNVQDQSGNGKHGTLVGGTFVSDTPVGTPGVVQISTKQAIYRAGSDVANTKQAVYRSDSLTAQTKQVVSRSGNVILPGKQAVYVVGITSFQALQTITQGGISGIVSYQVKQIINRQASFLVNTKQAVYSPGSSNHKTRQEIFSQNTGALKTTQRLYKSGAETVPLKSMIYKLGTNIYLTAQLVINEDQVLVGRIRLKGARDLHISLKGDISMAMKNQSIELYAGETKNLDVETTDQGNAIDLTGATIKWVMKKSARDPTDILLKELASGITVEDAAAGEFTIHLQPDDTKHIEGIYYHETEIIDVAGNVSTIMTGRITILPSGFNTR